MGYIRITNRQSRLDAYPAPQMDDLASEISKYKISSLDLNSAYNQVLIRRGDKLYTANCKL